MTRKGRLVLIYISLLMGETRVLIFSPVCWLLTTDAHFSFEQSFFEAHTLEAVDQ